MELKIFFEDFQREFNRYNDKDIDIDNLSSLDNYRNMFHDEYVNYHGNDENFDDIYNNLINKNFKDGGLKNVPEVIHLSRLLTVSKDKIKNTNNICWVRSSDEHLFYDRDWIFTVGVQITEDSKILRIEVNKKDINWKKTVLQNITFSHEKEITLHKGEISDYKIVDY